MSQEDSKNHPSHQQQTAGDVTVWGNENAFAMVSTTGNAAIDQSRHTIYNYYYYREESRAIAAEAVALDDNLACPYRGLFHFGPDDAEFFFGREVFVTELVQAVQTRAFVPVLGASGSGKSSVVLAGLVPHLQQAGHWQFTHFRPGDDPFHALALALVPLYQPEQDATDLIAQARKLTHYLRDGEVLLADVIATIQQHYPRDRVLLIADQFEELYTLCRDEGIRRRFLDCLLASLSAAQAASPLVLVATMRADFLGNALSYRPFADVLQDGDIKLGAMNRDELREVIERPAAKLGVTFEAGLVQRILDAVVNEPGNLPLLEFALTELWSRRNGRQLTHAAYEAIGEVEGALARYADQQYAQLSEGEQAQVRRIFVQLVRPGEGTEDTRRLATKAELGEERWTLVTRLANSRLVVTGQDGVKQETVEVVHEALIRNWGELRGWMNSDRTFRIWQDRLRVAMQQWEEMNRDEGALLRGAALVEAGERLQKRQEDLSLPEQSFIQAGLTLQQREQQQQKRRRQLTLLGLSGFSVVALGLAGMAGWQWQQSEKAQIETLMRSSKLLQDSDRPFDALLASLAAAQRLQQPTIANSEAQTNNTERLQQAVYSVREQNRLESHMGAVHSVVFSPDGKTLATGSADNTVKLWNVNTGQPLRILKGHNSNVLSVVFSPDGKTLATGSADNTVKLWKVSTGQPLHILKGHSGAALSAGFSPDGKTLASGSADNTVKLWNVSTGEPLRTLKGHGNIVNSVVFSPDGKTLASGSADNTVKLWNVSTGEPLRTLKGSYVYSVVFSPDGKTLASGSDDTTVKLWNVSTGQPLHTLKGHSSYIYSVVFSPDGKTLASGSDDTTVKLWNVSTGQPLRTLKGHTSTVYSVVFSPDGKTLATGSADTTVKLWNISMSQPLRIFKGHNGTVLSAVFSPNGRTLASSSGDTTVKLWNVSTGQPLRTLEGHSSDVWSTVFSPDGKTVASGSADTTVKLWNASTGQPLRTLKGHSGIVWSTVFSPDGRTLVSGSDDTTVKLWNASTGQLLRTLKGHSGAVYSVAFSPDGKTLASGSDDTTVRLWNASTGQPLHTFKGHSSYVNSVVFSPDGKTLVSGSGDTTVKLWNVSTGQPLHTLKGHSGVINSVVFSPDGKTLASGSGDTTVKLWNVSTGQPLHTLKGHSAAVWSVVFSPDSKTLVSSSSADTTIILWRLDTDFDLEVVRQRGCHWVRNYLQNNPNVSESDRHICDDVASKPG